MTERDVRKYHGTIGVVLSLFILVQVGSGILIAFNEFLGRGRHIHAEPSQYEANDKGGSNNDQNQEESLIKIIHHYGGRPVQALRMLLGLGVYLCLSAEQESMCWPTIERSN
jgi:hypothetical protein